MGSEPERLSATHDDDIVGSHTVCNLGFALGNLLHEVGFPIFNVGGKSFFLRVLHRLSDLLVSLLSCDLLGLLTCPCLLPGIALEGFSKFGIGLSSIVKVYSVCLIGVSIRRILTGFIYDNLSQR